MEAYSESSDAKDFEGIYDEVTDETVVSTESPRSVVLRTAAPRRFPSLRNVVSRRQSLSTRAVKRISDDDISAYSDEEAIDNVADDDDMSFHVRRSAPWKIKNRFQILVQAQAWSSIRKQGTRSWSTDHGKRSKRIVDIDDSNDEVDDGDSDTTASSVTPVSMSSSASTEKRVRFQMGEDGHIETEVSRCSVEISEEEAQNVWWSKNERREIKRQTNVLAASFLTFKNDYRLAIEQLLLKCSEESGHKIHRPEPQEPRAEPFTYMEALRISVDHEVRGLEQPMVNALNLKSCRFYYRCGQTSVATVLKAQATIKELGGVSVEHEAALIAMNLRQTSGFAAHFARMLAEGDALVATGAYDNTLLEPEIVATPDTVLDVERNVSYLSLEWRYDLTTDFVENQLCQL